MCRWYRNDVRTRERPAAKHTAMADIKNSLEELKWYKKHFFKSYAEVKLDRLG